MIYRASKTEHAVYPAHCCGNCVHYVPDFPHDIGHCNIRFIRTVQRYINHEPVKWYDAQIQVHNTNTCIEWSKK